MTVEPPAGRVGIGPGGIGRLGDAQLAAAQRGVGQSGLGQRGAEPNGLGQNGHGQNGLGQVPATEAPALPARAVLNDADFKAALAGVIPQLRAFGRSLSGNRDLADDLVQETLLKAWAARSRFEAGTNMRAWVFIILRNVYLSQMRRNRFRGEWDDAVADRILSAPAAQDMQIELGDMQRALQQLPTQQREALILVGAGGFGYEEAAQICQVPVGTIKSRVARGRLALAALLGGGALPSRRSRPPGDGRSAFQSVMDDVDTLSQKR